MDSLHKDILPRMISNFFDIIDRRPLALVSKLWNRIVVASLKKLRDSKIRLCCGVPFRKAHLVNDVYKEFPVCIDCFILDTKPDVEIFLSWRKKLHFDLSLVEWFVNYNPIVSPVHDELVQIGSKSDFDVFQRHGSLQRLLDNYLGLFFRFLESREYAGWCWFVQVLGAQPHLQ